MSRKAELPFRVCGGCGEGSLCLSQFAQSLFQCVRCIAKGLTCLLYRERRGLWARRGLLHGGGGHRFEQRGVQSEVAGGAQGQFGNAHLLATGYVERAAVGGREQGLYGLTDVAHEGRRAPLVGGYAHGLALLQALLDKQGNVAVLAGKGATIDHLDAENGMVGGVAHDGLFGQPFGLAVVVHGAGQVVLGIWRSLMAVEDEVGGEVEQAAATIGAALSQPFNGGGVHTQGLVGVLLAVVHHGERGGIDDHLGVAVLEERSERIGLAHVGFYKLVARARTEVGAERAGGEGVIVALCQLLQDAAAYETVGA